MRNCLLVLPLLLCACGAGSNSADNTRAVEREGAHDPYMRNVDESRRTEAQAAAGVIHRQVRYAAVKAGNPKGLYDSLQGHLDAGKLAKIGMSESDLQGSNYVASDYKLSFYGKKMTIEAVKPGQAGYTAGEYDVP